MALSSKEAAATISKEKIKGEQQAPKVVAKDGKAAVKAKKPEKL